MTPGLWGDRPPPKPDPRFVVPYDSTADTLSHIDRVRHYLTKALVALMNRAQEHDASKLAPPEKETFDVFTPKLGGTVYGSPEYKQYLAAMQDGLRHHYEVNRHHPEHHADGIAGMNLLDLLEMVCDWMAAVERHDDGDIMRSIRQNMERFGYDEQLAQIFANTVRALADGGPHGVDP